MIEYGIRIVEENAQEEIEAAKRLIDQLNIYNDVADLQDAVAELQAKVAETEWADIPLVNGAVAYNETNTPKYKKIGQFVIVRGAVKNVLGVGAIGNLPEGFRPPSGHTYVQNTSYSGGAAFVRMSIEPNGDIEVEGISPNGAYGDSKWFPIGTIFAL